MGEHPRAKYVMSRFTFLELFITSLLLRFGRCTRTVLHACLMQASLIA